MRLRARAGCRAVRLWKCLFGQKRMKKLRKIKIKKEGINTKNIFVSRCDEDKFYTLFQRLRKDPVKQSALPQQD